VHENVILWTCTIGLILTGFGSGDEFLICFKRPQPTVLERFLYRHGGALSPISRPGNLYKWRSDQSTPPIDDAIEFVHPNFEIHLFENPSIYENSETFVFLSENKKVGAFRWPTPKPDFLQVPTETQGPDPLLSNAWGVFSVGADLGWIHLPAQGSNITVAVIDTGIDYNHEDLIGNLWRNRKENVWDGIDNDHNGYIDDFIGWDFIMEDNKPFDMTASLVDVLTKNGNPGHGTHISGIIGARRNNQLGISGMAPLANLMALRFIDDGKGTTENALRAIDYAVANGAKIINASWGSESTQENRALREAIDRAGKHGIIFVAASGNGRKDPNTGKMIGYDNDSDLKPIVPASFSLPNLLSVAAINEQGGLTSFSNWGQKSVKLGAPAVKIFSTVPKNRYQDTLIDLGSIKVTWDGTSLAAPFVTGAIAAFWSEHPSLGFETVMQILLDHVKQIPSLNGFVQTGGILDMRPL